jgi:nitrate/nitrite transporter NarK
MQAGFLNSVPFALASVAMLLWARYSDRQGKRVWSAVSPLALSVVALAFCVASRNLSSVVLLLSFALIGTFSFKAPFWALSTETLGASAAAAGLAMINAVGNLGGFLGTYLIGVIRDATGSYLWALSPILICEAIGCVIILAIGRYQKRLARQASASAAEAS